MTSEEQLDSFMIYLYEREFISRSNLNVMQYSVNKVLSVINLDDFLNGHVVLDDVKGKLHEKYSDYSSSSILSYASRFRSLIKKYLRWVKNPEGYYPSEYLRKKKEKLVSLERIKFPIMVNGNEFGHLELPSKLTSDEALKIKEFLISATKCLTYE